MHPEFFTLPILDIEVKMYGFCLMVGFLSAVWLAMRRAQRVKADPDIVLDMSFLALLFGVGGARVFYVVHYWQSQFANVSNPLLAVIDIRGGGLEFLGGIVGALIAISIYAVRKKVSMRLYLDILAPSVMWGLAFGRIGCFMNGCCFGGPCVVPSTGERLYPWAVEFPFGSGAHLQQWEDRQVTVPAELITTKREWLQPSLIPASQLSMSVERRERPRRRFEELGKAYREAKAEGVNAEELAKLKAAAEAEWKKAKAHESKIAALRLAEQYPSRIEPNRPTSVSELEGIAAEYQSVAVHPTQLYSSIHAFLLSGVLSTLFYLRKRHGMVIGALFVLYPIPRVLLELIRVDNPHDVGGLTVSQLSLIHI